MAAVVPAKMRADIIMRRQSFRNEEYYVLKDPLALTYFRMQPEEAYIVGLLDGTRTLGEIAERVANRYPNNPRTVQELAAYVNQLGAGRLLNTSAHRFVETMRAATPAQSIITMWVKLISGALFFKLPLVDPSPWLGGLAHALRFVWTKWFVGGAILLFAWTVSLLVANTHEFEGQVLDFFSLDNLAILWVSMIFIKTLHEFGHATTCRHFGGEVHEMGVCFMCFTPCGYVDASDAWMMRHKRHKLYVTFAGVFTELIIASIAAHFWLILPDGLARSVAFNSMLVASINTVVFNANPLMRFDGYYVVCDLLEIPNLRSKSMAYVSYHLQRVFFGYRNHNQAAIFEQEARGHVFAIYAVLAYVYMIVIIYGITQIFGRVLQPFGLHDFGRVLGFFVLASFTLFPVVKVFMDAAKPGAHIEKTGSARLRLGMVVVALAAMAGLSFIIPTHYRITQQAVVVAAKGEFLASEVGGVVRKVHVQTGQWVEPGQLLVSLENPEVEAEYALQMTEVTIAQLQFGAMGSQRNWESREGQARSAQNMEVAEAGRALVQDRRNQLELRATTAGFVVTPQIEHLLGNYASPFHVLMRVADTRELRLLVPLTEDQAQLVEVGSEVTGRWEANGEPIRTTLRTVSSDPAKRNMFHPGMMVMWGGPTPMQALQTNGPHSTRFPIFIAAADLEQPGHFVVEGLRAHVTITGRPTTMASRFGLWFFSMFKVQSHR